MSGSTTQQWPDTQYSTKQWKYSSNQTCTDTTPWQSYDGVSLPLTHSTQDNNGKYICLRYGDAVLASSHPLNIQPYNPNGEQVYIPITRPKAFNTPLDLDIVFRLQNPDTEVRAVLEQGGFNSCASIDGCEAERVGDTYLFRLSNFSQTTAKTETTNPTIAINDEELEMENQISKAKITLYKGNQIVGYTTVLLVNHEPQIQVTKNTIANGTSLTANRNIDGQNPDIIHNTLVISNSAEPTYAPIPTDDGSPSTQYIKVANDYLDDWEVKDVMPQWMQVQREGTFLLSIGEHILNNKKIAWNSVTIPFTQAQGNHLTCDSNDICYWQFWNETTDFLDTSFRTNIYAGSSLQLDYQSFVRD